MTPHEEYLDESLHRAWMECYDEDKDRYLEKLQRHQEWPDLYPHPDELREMGRAS